MALTGRQKYIVRQMLSSVEEKNVRLAIALLKVAGYTEREIEHWKWHMKTVKDHKINMRLHRWRQPSPRRFFYPSWGSTGKELFDEALRKEAEKFKWNLMSAEEADEKTVEAYSEGE